MVDPPFRSVEIIDARLENTTRHDSGLFLKIR
jgi:hypothetical protein